MGWFKKLKKKAEKYAKAPLEQVRKDIKDPIGQSKQALNDPLARLREGATGEVGDVLPISPTDDLGDVVAKPYEDILAGMDPLELPDAEMLRLKARRNQKPSQRQRNTLTKRRSAFIPNRKMPTKQTANVRTNSPVGYYDVTGRLF